MRGELQTRQRAAQVGVSRALNVQVAAADIVKRLVVDLVRNLNFQIRRKFRNRNFQNTGEPLKLARRRKAYGKWEREHGIMGKGGKRTRDQTSFFN